MKTDGDAWQVYSQLRMKIKTLNMPLEELRALLTEYDTVSRRVAEQRTQQFASVVKRCLDAQGDHQQIGAIIREFAEYAIAEVRINGMKPKETVEEIVDQIADMEVEA